MDVHVICDCEYYTLYELSSFKRYLKVFQKIDIRSVGPYNNLLCQNDYWKYFCIMVNGNWTILCFLSLVNGNIFLSWARDGDTKKPVELSKLHFICRCGCPVFLIEINQRDQIETCLKVFFKKIV